MERFKLGKKQIWLSLPGALLAITGLTAVFYNTSTAILMMLWGMMLTPIFWSLIEQSLKKKISLIFRLGLFLLTVFILAAVAPYPNETKGLIQMEARESVEYILTDLDTTASNFRNTESINEITVKDLSSKNTEVTPVQVDSTLTNLPPQETFSVVSVTDGDTLKVNINGAIETMRVIGINTPETVHPSKPVECFGREASAKAKELLTGTKVIISYDQSQGRRDKYDRLLAYVTLADGRDFGETMIKEGFAYEYTHNIPYEKKSSYQAAQTYAQTSESGLWADGACGVANISTVSVPSVQPNTQAPNCNIKGNISASGGEKIYHVPGQQNYSDTVITEAKGESWFCTEAEALAAGWRKALR